MIKVITIRKNNMMKEELIEEFKCYRSSMSRFKDLPDDEILEFLNQGYIKLIKENDTSEKLLGIAHVIGDIQLIIDFLPLFDETDKENMSVFVKSVVGLLENSIRNSLAFEEINKLLNITLNVYIDDSNVYLKILFNSLGYRYYTYGNGIKDNKYVLYTKSLY